MYESLYNKRRDFILNFQLDSSTYTMGSELCKMSLRQLRKDFIDPLTLPICVRVEQLFQFLSYSPYFEKESKLMGSPCCPSVCVSVHVCPSVCMSVSPPNFLGL
jgi:hypothetical protein